MGDRRAPREDGLEAGALVQRRIGRLAVEQDAGADEVEVAAIFGRVVQEEGAAVGDVAPFWIVAGRPETLSRALEVADLGRVLRVIEPLGVGQVRCQPLDAHVSRQGERAHKIVEFAWRDADAPHARVELDVGPRHAADAPGRFVEAPELLCGKDERHEIVRHDFVVIRPGAAEHEDVRGDAGLPELHALLDERDAEEIHAALGELLGDGNGAVSVGVGLDHGQQAVAVGQRLAAGQVVSQGGQVDLGHGRAAEAVARGKGHSRA